MELWGHFMEERNYVVAVAGWSVDFNRIRVQLGSEFIVKGQR